MTDGAVYTLNVVAKDFRENILIDLQRIRFAKLSATAVQNEFSKIPNSSIYVYQHKEYMAASNVEFTNIQRACGEEVTESYKPVFLCKSNTESHKEYMAASNVEFTNIQRACGEEVTESYKPVFLCKSNTESTMMICCPFTTATLNYLTFTIIL